MTVVGGLTATHFRRIKNEPKESKKVKMLDMSLRLLYRVDYRR